MSSSSLDKWNYTYELLLEGFEKMMTVSDPKFVEYYRYYTEGLYLRWLPIRVDTKPSWADHLEYHEFEDEMIEWLCVNCKGRFSTKHWAFVCFEDRRDAMLFKMTFS